MTDAREALERLVVDVPDYPDPGVVFKDITPQRADHAAISAVILALAGAGRDEPTPQRPVGKSPAAGRQQPTRQPRSKRK